MIERDDGMTISDAIGNKRLLQFIYHGHSRVVEPHAFGLDTKGHPALRAYQVAGGSSSGDYRGWKTFHVDEIRNLAVLAEGFAHARTGYRRGDTALQVICAQL